MLKLCAVFAFSIKNSLTWIKHKTVIPRNMLLHFCHHPALQVNQLAAPAAFEMIMIAALRIRTNLIAGALPRFRSVFSHRTVSSQSIQTTVDGCSADFFPCAFNTLRDLLRIQVATRIFVQHLRDHFLLFCSVRFSHIALQFENHSHILSSLYDCKKFLSIAG